ncbi:unnamed protein product [Polarella glacialis]|uniref:NADP-dependent oxidoreductase domain-containing protein n=1 Tax=Polarella glacialis TaxID=89957 RepID=A0A813LUJ4_POLGL|nr:unnamed protein product [Polarella glacialis]
MGVADALAAALRSLCVGERAAFWLDARLTKDVPEPSLWSEEGFERVEEGYEWEVAVLASGPARLSPREALLLRGGLAMPRLGLGLYCTSPQDAYAACLEALGVGYRLIDTASMYQNEAAVGAALRNFGLPRDQVYVVASPDGFQNSSVLISRLTFVPATQTLSCWHRASCHRRQLLCCCSFGSGSTTCPNSYLSCTPHCALRTPVDSNILASMSTVLESRGVSVSNIYTSIKANKQSNKQENKQMASRLRPLRAALPSALPFALRRSSSTATQFPRWQPLACQSDAGPLARSAHSVTAVEGRVAVFGGEDKPRCPFDSQVHLLDTQGVSWEVGPEPCVAVRGALPVLGHGAAAVGEKLFVFGGRRRAAAGAGQGAAAQVESGELLAFNTHSGEWSAVQPTGGDAPEPRSFHAMTAVGEDLFVFGGCGKNGRLGDLWRFDTAALRWQCLARGEGGPAPRGGSSLIGFSAQAGEPALLLLMFGFDGKKALGDLHGFSLKERCCAWEDLTGHQQGQVPRPRSVMALSALGSAGLGRRSALVFGGESEPSEQGPEGAGKFLADTFSLDVASLTWIQTLAPQSEGGPCARGWTGTAVIPASNGSLEQVAIMFGGLDETNARLDDVWMLPIVDS